MAKKRVERAEEECNSNSNVAVDRISKLPDSVMCHILSFVPTVYVVRMSVLSRRWRRTWYSVPTLDFSDTVGFHKRESFNVFVDNCLMHRSKAMHDIADSVVTSFKIDISYSHESDCLAMNRWSKSPIIQNNVKELDICAGGIDNDEYMPSVALNGRSLSIIKLNGLKLDTSCSVNLPSLKSLCLKDIVFEDDDVLRNLILQCPSLEKLVLVGSDFFNLRISSLSLKFLEIEAECYSEVEIDALNLQSLVADFGFCSRIRFYSCREIRYLSLSRFFNGLDQNFEYQISKLTCLENLILDFCENFEQINICSPTLKCFSLTNLYGGEVNVAIETPNLVSFKYVGYVKFSVIMKTPNPQLSGSFSIWEPTKCDTNWYTELITFLSNINCTWNCLSLSCFNDTALIIPEDLRETSCPPWPNLKHLKVTLLWKSTRMSELRKSLEWLSPSLETLSIEKKTR